MHRRNMVLLSGLALAGCGHIAKTAPEVDGHLLVTVTGLPDGVAARLDLVGPGGVTTAYAGDITLDDIAPGRYGVAAGYVNAAAQTYTASVSPGTVDVVDGDTATISVTYTAQPATALDLSISHVQLIQSTQRSDGSIPMVANRDVLLRVFATATGGNTAHPPVRVRLFQGSVAVDSITVLAGNPNVPTSVDTGNVAASWNVIVPAARVVPGVALQVEIDPGDYIPETSKSNNRWPGGSATSAITLHPVPPFNLRFIPVRQTINGGTGAVNGGNKDALARVTRSVYPLAATTVSVRSTFATDAPLLMAGDENNGWGQILNEVSALRTADQSQSYYVGIVPANYGGGIAGLGYIGFPAAIAWDHNGATGVIAHELGHNFGRAHTPCGGPANPDLSYPYPGAVIGTWGIDVEGFAIKPPTVHKDLMSYCSPTWIGDYTYMAVLNYRDAEARVVPTGEAVDGLMIWGRVVQGQVYLEPAFRVHAPVKLPARPGRNRIDGMDEHGNRIFQLSFDGDLVGDLPRGEERHFAYVIPLTEAEQGRLAALRLEGDGLTAHRVPSAGLSASRAITMPTATITPNGEIHWDHGYPLAIIRDSVSGEILSFARGGVTTVEPGRSVRVDLSDGVGSVSARAISHPAP